MSDVRQTDLTIVVPTRNRHRLLGRLLRYYRLCGAPFPIHILDSSDEAPIDPQTRQLLDAPHVSYTSYEPSILPTVKLAGGLARVSSPYVVLWADDDLLVPRTVGLGVRFLEQHPDYAVAHGHSGLFQVTARDSQVAVDVGPYKQVSYLDRTAAQRVLHYYTDNSTIFYSVHRTHHLLANITRCCASGLGAWDSSDPIHRSDWWVEQLLACLSLADGKAKQLNDLYMLRERHAGTDSWEAPGGRLDLFDWVTSSSFSKAYEAFCACVSEAIARQDGLPVSEARGIVKQAFWAHLSRGLTVKWRSRYAVRAPAPHGQLRETAKAVPGFRRVWRAARSRLPGREFSLEALRRRSSPHHADFLAMYRVIAGELGDGNGC